MTDPDIEWATAHRYLAGAKILILPSGRVAVYDTRYNLRMIANSFPEALDTITELSIIPPEAAPPSTFTLEDLGL